MHPLATFSAPQNPLERARSAPVSCTNLHPSVPNSTPCISIHANGCTKPPPQTVRPTNQHRRSGHHFGRNVSSAQRLKTGSPLTTPHVGNRSRKAHPFPHAMHQNEFTDSPVEQEFISLWSARPASRMVSCPEKRGNVKNGFLIELR